MDLTKLHFFLFDQLGVDIDAATKHGIKVARIPGDVTGNAASCAEMAIYLMLGLLRKQV
jgi:lactate dehydrogenase-like 2-hydroxyacid dehydrogenase